MGALRRHFAPAALLAAALAAFPSIANPIDPCPEALLNWSPVEVVSTAPLEVLKRAILDMRRSDSTTQIHLEISASPQGEHGQHRITRLLGAPWHSIYNPIPGGDAKLGDPRWFLGLFSEYEPGEIQRIGRFFGFAIVDDRTLLVPGVELLQQKVRMLELPGLPRFYQTHGHHSELAYLRAFVDDFGVPMDTQGILRAHDLAFHAGSLLIPARASTHARQQVFALFDFMAFTLHRAIDVPPPFAPAALKAKFEAWLVAAAIAVDGGSGNFVRRLAIGSVSHAAQAIFESMTAHGRSPREYLEAFVTPPPHSQMPRIDPQMGRWLRDRLAEYAATRGPQLNRRLYDEYDAALFTLEVRARVQEVVEQVLRLSPP